MADPANRSRGRGPGFSRTEAATLRQRWRSGGALLCPRCGGPLEATAVPPRSDVAYVRDRLLLHCTGCGASAAVEKRDRRLPFPKRAPETP